VTGPAFDPERLRGAVDARWTDERASTVARAMGLRSARRRRRRVVGLAGGLALAAAVGVWTSRHRSPATVAEVAPARRFAVPEASAPPATAIAAAAALTFADGSRAAPLDAGTKLVLAADEPGRVVVGLGGGAARFDVVHRPERTFRVQAGDFAVEVLGTVFTVAPGSDGSLHVACERGRVRVLVAGSALGEVGAGEEASFTASAGEPGADTAHHPAHEPSGAHAARSAEAALPESRRSDGWARLAERGDYDAAFVALERGTVPDDVAQLLLAADVARLSHHGQAALQHLRGVLERHAGDPRAPLAAFTLGRVLLDDLGQPRQAAAAFAEARRLAPRGPLAGDALAREVEAWAQAGEKARAKDLAADYLLFFPDGPRARVVRRQGGLE